MALGDLGLPSSVPPAVAHQARRVESRLGMETAHHRYARQGESESDALPPLPPPEGRLIGWW